MAEVIVTITPEGRVTVHAEGWQGPTCATVTEPYRKALGRELDNKPTPEMFQEQSQHQEQQTW